MCICVVSRAWLPEWYRVAVARFFHLAAVFRLMPWCWARAFLTMLYRSMATVLADQPKGTRVPGFNHDTGERYLFRAGLLPE